jgi:hypothetical protein
MATHAGDRSLDVRKVGSSRDNCVRYAAVALRMCSGLARAPRALRVLRGGSHESQGKRDLADWHSRCFIDAMSVTPENALEPDLARCADAASVTFGSCLCGDVGYRITGQPLRMVDAPNLFVPVRQFRWTRGESQVVSYRLPGPRSFASAYCRRCGADVPRAVRGLVVVPPMPPDKP